MDKLVSQRENVLLGYTSQSQRCMFVNHRSNDASMPSSSSSMRSSDIDFGDVFGGPPRRVSVQETRYSFGGSRAVDHDDDDSMGGEHEKPVFGDREGVGVSSRRRGHTNEDFFDDIFRGKELYSSSGSPRSKLERDSLSSAPRSRVLSPVRPLPPRADHQQLLIGGISHFPAQFSLPSRVISGTELPTFGSPARNQLKNKDSGSIGSSNYPHSPLSRLSSQANSNHAQEVLEGNVRLRTYLSNELSLSSEEWVELEKPEAKETTNKLERQLSSSDSDGPQVSGKGGQFHFSIYKWASKGPPVDLPQRTWKALGPKEKGKFSRPSSFDGWMNGKKISNRSPRVTSGDQSSDLRKDSADADAGVPSRVELMNDVEEASLPIRKSESSKIRQVADMKHSKEETELVPGLAERELLNGKVNLSFVVTQEAPKPELKPVRTLISVNDLLTPRAVNDKVVKSEGLIESKAKSIKHPAAVFDVGEVVKKGLNECVSVDGGDVEKANVGGLERNLRSSIGENKCGGKVKDFIKIFNQEPAGKRELNVETQRQDCWRKEMGKPSTPDAATAKSTGIREEPNSQSKDIVVDSASILVDENPRRREKQKPETTADDTSSKSTPATNLVSGTSLKGSAPDLSEAFFQESDDSFEDNYLIEEIQQDDHKLLEETSVKSKAEEVQAIDDKIRNWSRGKEGNIRSLLSTLQYVLWPGSGWKTVPLVDIVEGNAVRKPYQKAMLCLHPDKLQQKGATAHQKYIAEKVFDILQEAWTQFNSHDLV